MPKSVVEQISCNRLSVLFGKCVTRVSVGERESYWLIVVVCFVGLRDMQSRADVDCFPLRLEYVPSHSRLTRFDATR